MNNTLKQTKRQYTFQIQDTASEILGSQWPVSRCLKSATSAAGVEIRHNGEYAHYHGVQTCQSPWTCPVCSRRIMAGRKAEIENVLLQANRRGWRSLFLTVTLSHNPGSRLDELLKALVSAWRSVFSGDRTGERAVFSRVMAQVKSLEVRYGRNGWHPHFHIILLVDESGMDEAQAGLFEDKLAETIFSRYSRAVERLGMAAEREAYDWKPVSNSSVAAHYVTKLENSIALEVTGSENKSNSRSYTAFQLLALYERGERQLYGHEIAALYREYATSTKGKRQVSYSREIKALLDIETKPDEELALEPEKPDERVLAVMSREVWRLVVERKLRAYLLEIADSGDAERVERFLAALVESASIPILETV